MKWDYRVIDAGNSGDPGTLEGLLKQHGHEGWELVAALSGGWLVFKRPLA